MGRIHIVRVHFWPGYSYGYYKLHQVTNPLSSHYKIQACIFIITIEISKTQDPKRVGGQVKSLVIDKSRNAGWKTVLLLGLMTFI